MPAPGSLQLRMFRRAIRDGRGLELAAACAGMDLAEAKLTLAADEADPPGPECFELIGATIQTKGDDMANSASKTVDGEIPKPDFDRAIKILKGDLNPLTEESAKVRGDQAAAWKTIEKDCHCNKKAMKQVHALMRMDPELRDDYLRTLYGGMQAAGIAISEDLVDKMGEGDAPKMPTRQRSTTELHTVQ